MEATLTWVNASPYLQLCGGLVWDFKRMTDADQVQRHAGDFTSVIDPVLFRYSWDYHI